jgi:hypothetical protein
MLDVIKFQVLEKFDSTSSVEEKASYPLDTGVLFNKSSVSGEYNCSLADRKADQEEIKTSKQIGCRFGKT